MTELTAAVQDGLTGNYYAMCAECEPLLPMPFAFVHDREEWIQIHKQATGHRVLIAQDVDFDALNSQRP